MDINKREFEIVEAGTTYKLPKFKVTEKGLEMEAQYEGLWEEHEDKFLQKITFVRGDKTDSGKVINRVSGILHEQLLAMLIEDLKYKSGLVPSRETSIAITKLEEALMWLEERQRNRITRNVSGTYQQ